MRVKSMTRSVVLSVSVAALAMVLFGTFQKSRSAPAAIPDAGRFKAWTYGGDYLPAKLPDGRQRAFPTAEGFGAAAKGGRGGRVIYVDNTNDDGPGSLRACIQASGPRNCVFRVGGTIALEGESLVVRNPFLTIAGETAPGGGIAIRNSPTQVQPSIVILTHDVIIRHIRLRPGPHSVEACCAGALGMYTPAATDIMLDHISASWGSDETVDAEEASDFTWQWGLVGEPLLNGGPGKRDRARNMMFSKGGNVTVHHTLFTQGQFRNPLIQTRNPGSVADVVNNVMYSRIWKYVISFADRWTHINANVVGNYKIAGDDLSDGKFRADDHLVYLSEEGGRFGHSIFVKDNYDEPYRTDPEEPDQLVMARKFSRYLVDVPFDAPAVRTTSPQEAYVAVLAGAGATKPERDAVDTRLVADVVNRSGQLLKSDPEDFGGWPTLEKGTPYTDTDKDGISDSWEQARGLDPADPGDGQLDQDADGWTNFEEFLHELAGDTPPQ